MTKPKPGSKKIKKALEISDIQRLTLDINQAYKIGSEHEAIIVSDTLKMFRFLIHRSKPVKHGDSWILMYKYPFNEEVFYVNDPR